MVLGLGAKRAANAGSRLRLESVLESILIHPLTGPCCCSSQSTHVGWGNRSISRSNGKCFFFRSETGNVPLKYPRDPKMSGYGTAISGFTGSKDRFFWSLWQHTLSCLSNPCTCKLLNDRPRQFSLLVRTCPKTPLLLWFIVSGQYC